MEECSELVKQADELFAKVAMPVKEWGFSGSVPSEKTSADGRTTKLDRGLCLRSTKNCADYDSRGFEPATPVAGPATLRY